MIRMITKEEVAHHEAGHAVVAVHLEVPLSTITVVPSETYLGKVKAAPPPAYAIPNTHSFRRTKALEFYRKCSIITIAGMVAQGKYRGWPLTMCLLLDILDTAMDMLDTAPPESDSMILVRLHQDWFQRPSEDFFRWRRRVLRKTGAIIETPAIWNAVQKFAALLLTESTVEGSRAEEFIRSSLRSPQPKGKK